MTESSEAITDVFKPNFQFLAAFSSLAIVSLAAALDATIIAVALPIISTDIHGSATQAFWAGTSFLLASTVLMLDWVAFSHVFGRRIIMFITCGSFALGSILCAVSHNFTLMLVGRTIQGAGAGGFVAVVQVIITDMVPLRQRAKYYALLSTVYAVGSIAGPIVGGALAQHGAWRWIFWLNLPIIGVGVIGLLVFLKLRYRERSFLTKLAEIDYVGSFLFITSLTSFLIPVTWGGIMYSWSSWRTLVPLLLGAAGLLAFTIYEWKTKHATIIQVSLFSNRSTSIVFLGAFCQGVILWANVYYMPEYFQSVKGYSPTISGLSLLPQGATTVPSAIFVGVVVGITGKYRWALWLGWALATLGLGVMTLLDVHTSIASWIFIQLVSGTGVGILFPAIAMSIQASSPQEDTAVAATLGTFFRYFGQTLGVAVGGTIFQNRMRQSLESIPSLADKATYYAANSVVLVEQLKLMPHDSDEAIQLRIAFAHSYRTIWIVMCALAGFALIANLFVQEYDLNQAHLTDQGFVNGVDGQGQTDSDASTVPTENPATEKVDAGKQTTSDIPNVSSAEETPIVDKV